MKLSKFVKNLPEQVWCFKDGELRYYDICWSDDPLTDVFFKDSGNDLVDTWGSWEEFLDDCGEIYLSVDDFRAGKQLVLEL